MKGLHMKWKSKSWAGFVTEDEFLIEIYIFGSKNDLVYSIHHEIKRRSFESSFFKKSFKEFKESILKSQKTRMIGLIKAESYEYCINQSDSFNFINSTSVWAYMPEMRDGRLTPASIGVKLNTEDELCNNIDSKVKIADNMIGIFKKIAKSPLKYENYPDYKLSLKASIEAIKLKDNGILLYDSFGSNNKIILK